MNNEKVLDISWKAIFKISLIFFCFYFIYLIREILSWVIFALIISLLFNPAINFLQKRRIPREVATALIYIGVFGILGLLIYSIFPPLISETQHFLQIFPQYFEKMSPLLKKLGLEAFESVEAFTKTFQDWLIRASSSLLSLIISIFGGIFSALTIFIIAIFLSLEEKGLERMISLISPKKYQPYFLDLWQKSQRKISAWFACRILACLFVGLAVLISCKIFAIKYRSGFLKNRRCKPFS